MTKLTKASLAAFQRRNGRWAIAVRIDIANPTVVSAHSARVAANVLHDKEYGGSERGVGRVGTWLAAKIKKTYVNDLLLEIAQTLDDMADIVDAYNARAESWPMNGREYDKRDTARLH